MATDRSEHGDDERASAGELSLPSMAALDAGLADIGRQVRSLRRAGGWTQAEVAEAAGISRQLLSRMERGTVQGQLATLLAVVTGLGGEIVVAERASDEVDITGLAGMSAAPPPMPTGDLPAVPASEPPPHDG